MTFDVEIIRQQFPSLAVTDGGKPRVYLDNPAGTQVPRQVIGRVVDHFTNANANSGGFFMTSRSADAMVAGARADVAQFLNANCPEEIVFGQSMTALTFHISRSLARTCAPGDEILLTRQEHDGNVGPWLAVARDHDLVIKWIDLDPDNFELRLDQLASVIGHRTKIVAIGLASNCTGTINDISRVIRKAKEFDAIVYVDAVQFLPHRMVDVQELGCDFLICSPYKFFGPHVGVLWGKRKQLELLPPYKVRPAPDTAPDRLELGALPFELIAGLRGTFDYLDWCAQNVVFSTKAGRRERWLDVYREFQNHEDKLCRQLMAGLAKIQGIRILGITSPNRIGWRVPTVSFVIDKIHPDTVAKAMAEHNFFIWSGHNYAIEVISCLGLLESGGGIRIGVAHYNSEDEVAQCLATLEAIMSVELSASTFKSERNATEHVSGAFDAN